MKAQNMRRREFLKAVGIGAAAAVMPRRACAAARAAGKDSPRPNIVWISAEDISPTVGCYGDKYATTPNLDKFASQGVRYDAAFAHAPVCAPARSGIITGMYPTRIGTTWMRCRGVPPVEARCFPEYLRAAGYYCTNSSKTDYQFAPPRSAWDESSGGAHFRKRRQKDQPFFAVFNFTVSHESSTRRWTPGKQEHDPAKAPLPPYYPDTPIVRQNIACYYDKMSQLDSQIRRVLDELEADGLAENTIVWFWGDHGWGLTRGKRWIYDSGLRVPLMVRVPSKLRAWAGAGDAKAVAPGRAEKELVSFIDFAPTVLSLAGVPIPPHMQGQAFLGPQKAARPREYIFGARDRMDETYDCIRCLRDKRFKYIRNFMPYVTRGQHIAYMDRTPILQEMRRLHAAGELKPGPQMQYFEPTKPVHELYDTVADPHEVNNLAGEAKYRDVLERMNKALKQFMLDIGDVGLIPEPDFDAMKGGGATAAPAFSVAPAGEGKAATVTISCPTPGASITYQVVKAAPA
ncbi:MAG: sulfatase, partial [Phycisphaerae bacterium]